MPENDNIFENHQLKIEIIDDVLHAHYKAGIKLTLEDAKHLVSERLKLCKGKSYHFMIYDGGVVSMDRDARIYFSSEEGIAGILSAAFIESSVFSKMLINFFLKITTPKVRSKAFTNLEDAMTWIRGLH
jgi:uncharacterized protein (UPF0261 family)